MATSRAPHDSPPEDTEWESKDPFGDDLLRTDYDGVHFGRLGANMSMHIPLSHAGFNVALQSTFLHPLTTEEEEEDRLRHHPEDPIPFFTPSNSLDVYMQPGRRPHQHDFQAIQQPYPDLRGWQSSTAETEFYSSHLQSSTNAAPLAELAYSRTSRPLASNHRVACMWGTSCHILLDDLSPSGIIRHLKEYHHENKTKPWHPKNRGPCQWWGIDGVCNKELNYASFGKHVAAVHLGSTSTVCDYCGQALGRRDSLERHMQKYCGRRPNK